MRALSSTWTPWRRNLAFLSALVIGVGAISWTLRPGKQSLYQGRAAKEWLGDLDEGNPGVERARTAVKALGTNSLPTLLKWITARDSRIEVIGRKLIATYFLTNVTFAAASQLQMRALLGFQVLGEQAAPAVPSLIRVLRDKNADDNSAEVVAWALASIGEGAIMPLVDAAKSDNPTLRKRAIRSLGALASIGKLGRLSSNSFKAVVGALDDAKPEVRLAALDSVRDFTNEVRVLVPKLMSLMDSKNLEIQRAATHALVKAGAPPEAIPLFTRVLNHPDPAVRIAAAAALQQIRPDEAHKQDTGSREPERR